MAIELIEVQPLDSNLRIAEDDGTPTKEFEDAWFQLSRSIEAINACLEDHETRLVAGGL